MLTVVTWMWGDRFRAVHVNVLRRALARHLHLPHRLVCLTDRPLGLDAEIDAWPLPCEFRDTPRCRRRMAGFSADLSRRFGPRVLYLDLDVVLVDDITPIVDRAEPVVCWRVGHAGVYSGSFILADAGALDGAYDRYRRDPVRYPRRLQPNGVASDQAMLNDWLSGQPPIPYWTERDGFVTYYGRGYERLEHLGVGPTRPSLPPGARIVVLGSADLDVLTSGRFAWADEHWAGLRSENEVAA